MGFWPRVRSSYRLLRDLLRVLTRLADTGERIATALERQNRLLFPVGDTDPVDPDTLRTETGPSYVDPEEALLADLIRDREYRDRGRHLTDEEVLTLVDLERRH